MKSSEKIRALIILEILGKPPEHLKETLGGIVKSIENENAKILSKKISEPNEIKEQKGFYTSFAEIELELDSLFELFLIVFKYMPAHVDILSPEEISMSNNEGNSVVNELTRRLHGYDEVARVLMNEKVVMQKKLDEMSKKKK